MTFFGLSWVNQSSNLGSNQCWLVFCIQLCMVWSELGKHLVSKYGMLPPFTGTVTNCQVLGPITSKVQFHP